MMSPLFDKLNRSYAHLFNTHSLLVKSIEKLVKLCNQSLMCSDHSLSTNDQDTLRKINFDNFTCQNAIQEYMESSEAFMRCSSTFYSRMSTEKSDNKMDNMRLGIKEWEGEEKFVFRQIFLDTTSELTVTSLIVLGLVT